MTKNKGKTLRMKLTLVAAAVIGLTVVAARPAAAFTATNSCVPSIVQYDDATSLKYLLVQCPGGLNFFAQVSVGGACSANSRSVDAQKMFQSISESALLAGKTVNIYYNTCGGLNYIEAMDLVR